MGKIDISIIESYINAGLKIIPLQADKSPIEGYSWTKQSFPIDFFVENQEWEKIGMACGLASGSAELAPVEVIDIDLKHDRQKEIMDEFVATALHMDKNIFNDMTVESTMSGGYHFIYRVDKPLGNTKLALNAAGEAVIETRGEGGYIAISPSDGYFMRPGHSLLEIKKITTTQRDILFFVARSISRVYKKVEPLEQRRVVKGNDGALSVFDDFNDRGSEETIDAIISSGWEFNSSKGDNTYFKRPGSKNKWGASYHTRLKVFYVFTSSSVFEQEKGYNNTQVYAYLKHDGDFKLAYADLKDRGFGATASKQTNSVMNTAPVYHTQSDGYNGGGSDNDGGYEDFLLGDDADDEEIMAIRDGTLVQGRSFSITGMDEYFVYKPETYVLFIGIANVGKTTTIMFLLFQAASLYKEKWVLYVSENNTSETKIILYQFYIKKPIKQFTNDDLASAKIWVNTYFKFFTIDRAMSIYNILDVTDKIDVNGVFIDPYSMLVPPKGHSVEVQDRIQTDIHIFKKKSKKSVWISIHAYSDAARAKDNDGFTKAPGMNDALHGVAFAGRADDVITIHRKTKHPDRWMLTEFHVHKIKVTRTGGFPTSAGNPVIMKYLKGGIGFGPEHEDSLETYNMMNRNMPTAKDRFDSVEKDDLPF